MDVDLKKWEVSGTERAKQVYMATKVLSGTDEDYELQIGTLWYKVRLSGTDGDILVLMGTFY